MPQGLRRKAGFCFAQIRKRSRVTGAGLSIRSPGKRSFPLPAFSSGFTGRAFLWRKAAAREVFPAPASGREQQGGFLPCGIRAGRQGGFRGRSGVPNHLPGGRETQVSLPEKMPLPQTRGFPSFRHQGCSIRYRLLSLNIQEKGLVYHPVGAVP